MSVHGTMPSYRQGCRCVPCRAASAARRQVERRQSREDALVDAGPARAHCFKLRACGLGYRQIAKLSGLSSTTVQKLMAGEAVVIRRQTSNAILSVQPRPALGIRIAAHETWRLIRLLKKDLFAPADIAQAIGLGERFRIGRKVIRLRTALRINRLYRSTQPEPEPAKELENNS